MMEAFTTFTTFSNIIAFIFISTIKLSNIESF